jgi:hypothetical protein
MSAGNAPGPASSGSVGDGPDAGKSAAAPDEERRQPLRARVISFFDSTTKTLVALGGLIAAVTALWAGIAHLPHAGANQAPTSGSTPLAVTAHVDQCESQHGLTGQTEKISRTVATTAFDSCTWPAPPYADADGFTEITLQTVPGPGQDEASDTDWADRVTGPCRTFVLSYDFGLQGALKHLAPFTAPAGLLTSIDQPGSAWPGGVRALSFYPARDEVDVLHNSNDVLASAACRS